ncbi:hypothetical protein E6Q11_04395 [Candidatus Dojkabacteria bacterium]|uniref:SurA N-terminal domain-containing protein n=1 Tax=Candidatus Dojkabacteria bacterium TaxID=2099670 RepID=A0A5C7J4Q8_9BACT|nr:MAG: hypothetical protein E6Q11_04395 [Candidatus Dojkabacteria bacterium]
MDPKTKKNAKSKKTIKKSTKTPAVTTESRVETKSTSPSSRLTSRNRKLIIVSAAVIFILVALALYYKSAFVAATVNGQPITRIAVVKQLESQSGKQTLDALVTQTLILQEAKKRNINITQKDVDAELAKITKNVEAQGSTLDQALAAQGMTKNQLMEQIKIQIALDKMVGNNFKATKTEIDDFVKQSQAQLPEGSTTTAAELETQAKSQIAQQKKQEAMQTLIAKLQKEAKIRTFVSY